jgi:hypothetical protein
MYGESAGNNLGVSSGNSIYEPTVIIGIGALAVSPWRDRRC